ncbi:hypothetical protein XENORESO_016723, partial [Xenotaenia resolanae]
LKPQRFGRGKCLEGHRSIGHVNESKYQQRLGELKPVTWLEVLHTLSEVWSTDLKHVKERRRKGDTPGCPRKGNEAYRWLQSERSW